MAQAKATRRLLVGFGSGALALLVGGGILKKAKRARAKPMHIERSLLVMKPRSDVYTAWRDFAKLPTVLRHVIDVDDRGDGRSHWKAQLFEGKSKDDEDGGVVEWDAQVVEERPGELLSWKSVGKGPVEVNGCVRFEPVASDEAATMMRVELDYKAVARGGVLRKVIEAELKEDLRRFKMHIEAGEVPTTSGQPVGANRKGVVLIDAVGGNS